MTLLKIHDLEKNGILKERKPMRVLCLFTILDRGGAETMCMNLYRNIDRSKVQFDFLVYHQERGSYEDEIETLGGVVYRIPDISCIISHIRGAKAFFKEHNEYHIVHNHMQSNGSFICHEAKKAGIKTIIYHSHAAPLPTFTWDFRTSMRRLRNKLINIIALRSCTDFFACGESAAEALPKNQDKKIVQNAIDLKLFHYDYEKRKRVRKTLNCNNKLIIGNVGRMDMNKNQSFLIDVFQQVLLFDDASELWLIGDGILRKDLETKVQNEGLADKVRFFGVRQDVNELLQGMDVFVFTSIAEGLPVSCIEAQAAGLPCVFSDGFDKHTKVTDKCWFLSLKKDAKTWAEMILKGSKVERRDTSYILKSAGFDIEDTSTYMQEFYISRDIE